MTLQYDTLDPYLRYNTLDTHLDIPQLNNPFVYDYNFYGSGDTIQNSYQEKKDINYSDYIKPAVGLVTDFIKGYLQYDTSKKMIGLQERQLSQRQNELEFFKTQSISQKNPIIIPPKQEQNIDRYTPMPMSIPVLSDVAKSTGISNSTMILIIGGIILLIFGKRLL